MKRFLVIAFVWAGFASAATAQGSLYDVLGMFENDGVTTSGPGASNPATATTWYTGNITIALYYAAASAVTTSEVAAMNAAAASGYFASVVLEAALDDGFTLVSATTWGGSTAGSLNYTASEGDLMTGPDEVSLLAPVPADGAGWIAMFATIPAGGGGFFGGFLAWWQPDLGNNPNTVPGTPAPIVVDPAGQNLVIGVPEPRATALAVIGGISLLLLLRRK